MPRLTVALACLLAACDPVDAPLPLPPPPSSAASVELDEPIQPLPARVELDEQRVELGRKLFHDPLLSQDGTVACAGCHPLDRGGSDGQSHSRGPGGKLTALNTPTIYNVGFNFRFNWNGAYATLEDELDAPMTRAMGTDWATVVAKLGGSAEYRAAFAARYTDGVTVANIRDALATYERSLLTPDARFDRWLRGDALALSTVEQRGYALFKEYGCASCHQGQNVGGNMFQRIGVMRDYFAERPVPKAGRTPAEAGRYAVTKDERDRHVFRVPSLRNVARTAPYFHDGSAATLEEAIAVMARFQLGRPLDPDQVKAIAAFLGTLTGEYQGKPL